MNNTTTTTTTNKTNYLINNKNNNNNISHHHSSRSSSNGTTTTQACAACKYQRRKCTPDCILAPYFPHDRHRQFLNAHKLFGVSNITKIIRDLDQPDKDEAMRTIIFQADVRAADPVGGCCRIICELQRQIEFHQAELDIVLHQLAFCRAQAAAQSQLLLVPTDPDNSSTTNPSTLDNNTNNCDVINVDQFCSYDPFMSYNQDQQQQQQQQQYILQSEDGVAVLPLQDHFSCWDIQDSTTTITEDLLQQQQHSSSAVNESCDGSKPPILNDSFVDAEAGIHEFKFEFEDTAERSEEAFYREERSVIVKEENGSSFHQEEDDLKSAAILFTTTN
ncbi:hypothetical protein LguiA_010011 [Lonicera macranthoides]